MTDIPSIQWFPGHMAKTRRMMKECLPLVDAVIEIVDARIPFSSRNPEMNQLLEGKQRIILLNKCDMADDKVTSMWLNFYQNQGIYAVAADCKTGKNVKKIIPAVQPALKELLDRRKAKGLVGRPIRLMVVGIPNVGKSSFINAMAKAKRTKVEDRPGVTRTKQWVAVDEKTELLDMPGVLWPKFEDPLVGERLAFTGAVKDDVVDIELLAMRLLEYLSGLYPENLTARYKININENNGGLELLEAVGRKRGMLISGGEVDTERAAIMVLDEYRSGKLGKITLELPEKQVQV